MNKPHFHYILAVWGEQYTKRFIEVILPLYFAMGNIKQDERHKNNLFVIVTTYNDSLLIKASESYQKLQNLIPTQFILIDGLVDFSNCYIAMSRCHELAMQNKKVIPGQTFFIFLSPDCFYSANTFDQFFKLVEQGYSVAMAFGIRTNAATLTGILQERLTTATPSPSISTAELITLALKHIHRLGQYCNWFSTTGFNNIWPSNVYWLDSNRPQLVAHCFHMHPIMIQSPRKKVAIGDTIDGDFLKNLGYPLSRHYVFTENYFSVDLTEPERDSSSLSPEPQLPALIKFGLYSAKYAHWHYFKHRIVLNGCPDTAINPEILDISDHVCQAVMKYQKLKWFLYRDWMIQLIYKIQRSRYYKLIHWAKRIKKKLALI